LIPFYKISESSAAPWVTLGSKSVAYCALIARSFLPSGPKKRERQKKEKKKKNEKCIIIGLVSIR